MQTGLLVLMLAIAVGVPTACTHKPYHPEKSDRHWASDHEECEKSVRAGVRDEPYAYDNFDEMRLIKQCMRDKGWQWERREWFRSKQKEAE